MKNLLTKILLVIIGILFSLFIAEFILRLSNYKPIIDEITTYWGKRDKSYFIKWAYIDIHKPFFKIDGNKFSIQRDEIWVKDNRNTKYLINKKSDTKRIFIVGESVARFFDEQILQKELSKYLNAEVINIGMGSYDTYRIEKITRELNKLSPDWIIFLIGNNDGINNYFTIPKIEPVDINILPYKYKVFKEIFTFNILSNLFSKKINLNKNNIELNFKKNIRKMLENLNNTKIIFCDIPANEYFITGNIFDNIEKDFKTNNKPWTKSIDYISLMSRIDFLKTLPNKYNNVYITNLQQYLNLFCENKLGYNIFRDNCHFNNATYILLSQLITEIIVKKEFNKDINILMTKQKYLNLSIMDLQNISLLYLPSTPEYYCVFFDILNTVYKYYKDDMYIDFHNLHNLFIENKNNKDFYYKEILFADILQQNKNTTESKKILTDLIKLVPHFYEAYLILGYIYYKENNLKQANEYFNIVKKLEPTSKIDVEYLKSLK